MLEVHVEKSVGVQVPPSTNFLCKTTENSRGDLNNWQVCHCKAGLQAQIDKFFMQNKQNQGAINYKTISHNSLDTLKSAPVEAFISSSEKIGFISFNKSPFLSTSNTQRSVIIKSTSPRAVSGKSHF